MAERTALTNSDVQKQVSAITQRIEEITGLTSRWNHDVVFSDEVDALGRPAFSAKKEWACRIAVHSAVLDRPGLFARLVHEALHAVSVGVERTAFMAYRGFEEGVVEWWTRRLAVPLAAELGIEAIYEMREVFDPYLIHLENMRAITELAEEEFYLRLIRTPLAQRHQAVIQWAAEAHPDELPACILAKSASDLRGLQ